MYKRTTINRKYNVKKVNERMKPASFCLNLQLKQLLEGCSGYHQVYPSSDSA